MKKADPVVLEPIMVVEVCTPDEYQGDIMGDINRRLGQIQDIKTKGSLVTITSFIPLEKMFGYSTDVRSLSKGRATYSMEPSHFSQIPNNQLDRIISSSPRTTIRQ